MNSLDRSSKWPSYDSLPSTPSFLHSESEHTEDEADIFSEGEVDSGTHKSFSADEVLTFSGSCHDFPNHSVKLFSGSLNDQSGHCTGQTKHPDSAPSPIVATIGSSSATPGDLAFAQKCADLRKFICPLLELLRGLKAGRFDKGLTSFQQSVAVDRLHRILGILQKPEMGERYLHNLLQIEMMLKIWFPQVALQPTLTQTITPRLLPRWRQNQLHMPVKKRKPAWSDPDDPGTVPPRHTHYQHEKQGSCQPVTSLDITCLPGAPKKRKAPKEEVVETPVGCWAARLEFTKTTGTLSRPSYLCSKTENKNSKQPRIDPASPRGRVAATQEGSVSTSANITTDHLNWP
ncbi:circadian associated repressor of transcription a [Scomber japonicus]|uniref:circadian associated repressor of transcription a n=1 Tax=Scomber japonicus TaxID=13676 RepID=UPI002305F266|nr:circadian associated repressor of transcription a [Scomber japonicus]